jgi:hypothetical protein
VIFDRFDDLCNHFISTFDTIRQEYNLKKRFVAPAKPEVEDMEVEGATKDVELILIPRADAVAELERIYRFMYSGKKT